ncbi:MAG: TolB family protein [Phycisphaeraceae bacterium JB051]
MPQPMFCLGGYELNRYHTYPHSNGFTVDGRQMVVMQMMPDHTSLWLLTTDLLGTSPQTISPGRRIASFDLPQPVRDKKPIPIWPDIAINKNILTVSVQDSIWLLNLDEIGSKPQLIYVAPKGWELSDLTSLKPDASAVCFGIYDQDNHISRCMEIDLQTQQQQVLLEDTTRLINHFHYSPHDPDWIGFAHEGPTREIPDRVNGYHPTLAPSGRCLFDQQSDEAGKRLAVGHERWCFHEASAIAVAYGASPTGPRGLYRIFADTSLPARLISEADRDWHCNVSRDGRHMVVDTSGPSDLPGCGWDDAGKVSDVVYLNPITGQRTLLARTQLAIHPWHPHPSFSPDGRWVFFNDFNGDTNNPRGRVGCVSLDLL